MTLRHVKIFTTVCETSSVTEAAEKLYIAQPSVSLAIKEMEEYYGIKLFDRISKKLYLTDEGKTMLGYSSHIAALFDEMENIRNRDGIGLLRIGASITVGTHYIPVIVSKFKEVNPNSEVNVIINRSEIIEDMLLRNDLDCAVIEGFAHSEYMLTEQLCDDKLCIVSNKKCEFNSVGDFYKEKFLLREKGSGTRELFDNVAELHGYDIKPVWESMSTKALINAAVHGHGISVIPYKLAESDIEAGRLQTINVDGVSEKLIRKFNLLYHKNKYISSLIQQFIDTVYEVLK
jgi:Transcriptional regulator